MPIKSTFYVRPIENFDRRNPTIDDIQDDHPAIRRENYVRVTGAVRPSRRWCGEEVSTVPLTAGTPSYDGQCPDLLREIIAALVPAQILKLRCELREQILNGSSRR